MSAFNQSQGTLALADTGSTAQQHADAPDIDQGCVHIRPGGKLFLEQDSRFGGEIFRLQLRPDDRDAVTIRQGDQNVVDGQTTGNNDGGDFLGKDIRQ